VPLYFGLTPNQVVAWNLAQARALKGWTQEEAAEALEPYLGRRWSKASFSTAERSVDSDRVREFDADEIVAFARAFDLPVSWFFLPPPPWAAPGIPTKLRTPDAEQFGTPLAVLADLVFGNDDHIADLGMRLQAFLQELGQNPLTDAQRQVTGLVETKKALLVNHAIQDLGRWQIQLRSLANQLEDLQLRAKHATERELAEDSLRGETRKP
jgi:transcriptional regulator with XRE-family HTH domain